MEISIPLLKCDLGRVSSGFVTKMWVSTGIEQSFNDGLVTSTCGEHQWSHIVVRSVLQQSFNNRQITFGDSTKKWRVLIIPNH